MGCEGRRVDRGRLPHAWREGEGLRATGCDVEPTGDDGYHGHDTCSPAQVLYSRMMSTCECSVNTCLIQYTQPVACLLRVVVVGVVVAVVGGEHKRSAPNHATAWFGCEWRVARLTSFGSTASSKANIEMCHWSGTCIRYYSIPSRSQTDNRGYFE